MRRKKIQKTNAIRLLDTERIHYLVHEYPWSEEHLDAKTAAEKVGMPLEKIYKTLVTEGDKTGIIVACIPATAELDLKALAKASGNKKVEMLAMKDLEKTTGYIRGGCSPLGMKKNYPTYIASQAELMDTIVVSAGRRGMQIEIDPKAILDITGATFANIVM
ncbi:Cys-tRNA(Pro) deacylase [Oceanobacillus piezotolerans]|uniref:Cys-tRNA(Pro)/Cys-tRNA(Cys) deacylase n=1 Tax=Oceanobacillus piezotolerans TaxID=2448030 RepID=A0A498D9K2_9BACI|nr:Cys-tRNA(Pro) deacylase [Oceanobacillus piezotolerans]RLL47784.1 Cys-tRNA(Pro) deacylase [Oceanobacillus piezotolerans]